MPLFFRTVNKSLTVVATSDSDAEEGNKGITAVGSKRVRHSVRLCPFHTRSPKRSIVSRPDASEINLTPVVLIGPEDITDPDEMVDAVIVLTDMDDALISVKLADVAVTVCTDTESTLIFLENRAVPMESVIVSTEFREGYLPAVDVSNLSVTEFSKVNPDILIESNTSFLAVIL